MKNRDKKEMRNRESVNYGTTLTAVGSPGRRTENKVEERVVETFPNLIKT